MIYVMCPDAARRGAVRGLPSTPMMSGYALVQGPGGQVQAIMVGLFQSSFVFEVTNALLCFFGFQVGFAAHGPAGRQPGLPGHLRPTISQILYPSRCLVAGSLVFHQK